ncbi:hypothetical protein Cs7R123_01260 [Catellatospora sp. TT07R-123]|uniref:hypothetical protein n=1 Tax=Catellatospora sp. TT07R-123 TaxID=2733863 RepID=UPI001B14C73A|nr:hypothetical protein [Catellatospora sp. TT07R-123]GHJ42784.1 hypothetical protein Cs7R123_01260 [Catellatospora sp. TT07R-123]
MSLTFAANVTGNTRGFIQQFLEESTDRDTDVYSAAVSTTDGTYAHVTAGWHGTGNDRHFTAQVFVNRAQVHTAHVYETGQVTAM